MIEKIIKEIERRMFGMMDDKLEIVTEFNNKNLILTTSSYFDGQLVSENEFDLEPMVDEIVERAVRACRKRK